MTSSFSPPPPLHNNNSNNHKRRHSQHHHHHHDEHQLPRIKQVSFVERVVLQFPAHVLPASMVIGDVDNDGEHEIAVAGIDGTIAVFKSFDGFLNDANPRPWKTHHINNTITCLALGDVRNNGTLSLVVVAGEGFCYIFDYDYRRPMPVDEKPTVSRRDPVPLNVSCAVITDIDGDGRNELVLGSRTRVVHVLELVDNVLRVKLRPVPIPSQVCSLSTMTTAQGRHALVVGMEEGVVLVERANATTTTAAAAVATSNKATTPTTPKQKKQKKKKKKTTTSNDGGDDGDYLAPDEEEDVVSMLVHPIRSVTDLRTAVCGDVIMKPHKRGIVGVCSTLGKCRVFDFHGTEGDEDPVELCALHTEGNVIAMDSLSVSGGESDELIVCCWDGCTFVVPLHRPSPASPPTPPTPANSSAPSSSSSSSSSPVAPPAPPAASAAPRMTRKQKAARRQVNRLLSAYCVSRFAFNARVTAFRAGMVCLEPGFSTPCFVYATFDGRIVVYYNVHTPDPSVEDIFNDLSPSSNKWAPFIEYAGTYERDTMVSLVRQLSLYSIDALEARRQQLLDEAGVSGDGDLTSHPSVSVVDDDDGGGGGGGDDIVRSRASTPTPTAMMIMTADTEAVGGSLRVSASNRSLHNTTTNSNNNDVDENTDSESLSSERERVSISELTPTPTPTPTADMQQQQHLRATALTPALVTDGGRGLLKRVENDAERARILAECDEQGSDDGVSAMWRAVIRLHECHQQLMDTEHMDLATLHELHELVVMAGANEWHISRIQRAATELLSSGVVVEDVELLECFLVGAEYDLLDKLGTRK